MAILENRTYRFVTDKKDGAFHVLIGSGHALRLGDNGIAVAGRTRDGKAFCRQLGLQRSCRPATHLAPESLYLTFVGTEHDLKLDWEVRVALSSEGRLIRWKVKCANHGEGALLLDSIDLLRPIRKQQKNFQFIGLEDTDPRFYANGWQSWSYTGVADRADRMRHSNLRFLQEPMVLNPGTPKFRARGKFSSDMFAVLADRESGLGVLCGFLSQREQFGSISADLNGGVSIRAWANCDHVRLDPDATLETDWFAIALIDAHAPFPLDVYLDAAAVENEIEDISQPPVGWCSWYHYYQGISESNLEDNLDKIIHIQDSTPLRLFQIDDGYQQQVGDWLSFNDKFPNGLKPLVNKITAAGLRPGLWLAPFIVHPRSQLAKDHPDWLLRRRHGGLARAGFVWNALGLALDLTVPDALDYVRRVIRTAVEEWGFTYLKLDFLYAAALECVYNDQTKTRAQVLRMGMRAVREAAGHEVEILGCGAPLGSALGLVDMMRVSADVSGSWKPEHIKLGFLFKNEPHMPSAQNAIHNTITRAMLHDKWWVNDPDCLLVREDTNLSLDEVQTLATVIAMTGGSILVSDDMGRVSAERLKIIQALIPPVNQRARVLDWLSAGTPTTLRVDLDGEAGPWHLLSYSNWEDQAREVRLMAGDFNLPEGKYLVNAFWRERSWTAAAGAALFEGTLQPHQTVLLAVRKDGGKVGSGGSYRHIAEVFQNVNDSG